MRPELFFVKNLSWQICKRQQISNFGVTVYREHVWERCFVYDSWSNLKYALPSGIKGFRFSKILKISRGELDHGILRLKANCMNNADRLCLIKSGSDVLEDY